jgi:hypothetical protein
MTKLKNLFALTVAALAAMPALADINVGVIASMTGPAAALGAETRKAVSLFRPPWAARRSTSSCSTTPPTPPPPSRTCAS